MSVLKTLIWQIEQVAGHAQRLVVLAELEKALQEPHPVAERKYLKSLLYHPDWYIRREIALLIDRYGIPLNTEEQFQFAFALQNFEYLYKHRENPLARKLLFQACVDNNPRVRSKAAAHVNPEECHTPAEEAAYLYAVGDYRALVELGCTPDGREPVVHILQEGLQQSENSNYHRRQCAFALEQLEAIEDAQAEIQTILETSSEDITNPDNAAPNALPAADPLEHLLNTLRQQGVWLDGQRVFPDIQIGTVTGRITYKNPALQTIPAADRPCRLKPLQGMVVSLDYRSIEPLIVVHFLLDGMLLNLTDIPEDDIYLAIYPEDRNRGKRWLNTIINGGSGGEAEFRTPFQQKLFEAIREWQQEVFAAAVHRGYVTTLGGRHIPLPQEQTNRIGKITNRLVQGSASDVFNRAVIAIFQFIQEHELPLQVYFLIYDEVWIHGEGEVLAQHLPAIQEIMETTPQEMGMLVPIPVRVQPM